MALLKTVIFKGTASREVVSLWRSVYRDELGWVDEVDEQLICDGHHHDCTYLLATLNGQPIGTSRIVFPLDGLLPLNGLREVPLVEANGAKAEVTRLMVLKSHRGHRSTGTKSSVFHQLMGEAISWCDRHQVRYLLMDVRVREAPFSLVQRLQEYGFTPLGNEYPDGLGENFPNCTTLVLDRQQSSEPLMT